MATAAEFVTPTCSHSFSYPQLSGVGEDAIVMVTLNSQSSTMSSESEKTMATVQPPSSASCPSRTLSRQSSSSSISSTDSCLEEAKYGHLHNQEFDFLLWFAESNVKEANMIFKVLEKEHQLRGFRYDRDQTIGRVRVQIISEAIKKSWKILLLLSPEADEDRWFVNQLTQSLTHDITQSSGNVVPILLRKSRKDLPSYLGSISSLLFPMHMDNDQIDSTRTSSSSRLPSSPTSSSSNFPSSPTCSSPTYVEGSSNTDSYEVEFARFVANLINIFTPTPPIERKRPSTSRSISRTSESSSSSWSSSWRSTKSPSTSSVSSPDSDSGSSSKSGSRRNPFAKFFQRK